MPATLSSAIFAFGFMLAFLMFQTDIISARLAVKIVPDPLTPVYGYRYFVRATLTVDRFDAAVFSESVEFKLINKGITCSVSDWKFCPLPPAAPEVWSCNCSSRTEHLNEAKYRFYFLIEKIDDSYSAEQVTARVSSTAAADRTVQMAVVKFSELPSANIFRCCDHTRAELHWNLVTRGHFQDRIAVQSVTWHKLSKEDIKANRSGIKIAKYDIDASGQISKTLLNSNYDLTKVLIGDLMFLSVLCDESVHEQFFRIKVRFNETTFLSGLSNYAKGRVVRSAIGNDPNCNPGSISFGHGVRSNCDTTTILPTTSDTTSTITSTSTTTQIPQLNYLPEHNQLFELVHTIKILRDVPPPIWRDFYLRVEETFTGDGKVLVQCGVSKQGIGRGSNTNFLGTPPINITIYTQIGKGTPKLLTYRVNEPHVPYTVVNVRDLKFICSLRGPAMDCVNAADKRCANLTNSTEAFNRSDFVERLDGFLILYALEMFVALTLIMWTCSNLFEHLRMVMTHERMEAEALLHSKVLERNVGSFARPDTAANS